MKILIIEDEPHTANILKEFILKIRPQSEVLAIFESITQTVKFFTETLVYPELVFMDIQLADGLSFDIFPKVSIKCPVIFCTAYDQYTLKAFKNNGIEYLLKPVKEEDIEAAFQKVENFKQFTDPENEVMSLLKKTLSAKIRYKNSILIRVKESFIPIPILNIALFYVENEIVYAITFDNQKYPVFKPMADIENEIDPHQFYRISRQFLINRLAVKEIQPYFNRKVVVKTQFKLDQQLVVSRLKVTDFMNWIEKS
ncbi:MAG: LytTR family DNA-binding domain-containing protein [Salinivirgaceae bacterium]|nr:LytTR family DNA-binding domain-containing protein [Salinivirgaceae bacterium]